MELLNNIFNIIEEHKCSGSSGVLAEAMASACSTKYTVSLLSVSASLDSKNKVLVDRLARITQEPDYSNVDQVKAIKKLKQLGFIN